VKKQAFLLLCCLPAAACHRRDVAEAPVATVHYTVPAPWRGENGSWFYPKENYSYEGTGLAVVEERPGPRLTADGEQYDARVPSAAMQALQLPAIVRVTNMENGRQILLRVNDLGPPDQGRLLAVSPAAATLLAMRAGSPAQVRVEEDAALSQRLASQLNGAPALDVAAAPVEGVQEQSLGAPSSAAHAVGSVGAASEQQAPTVPDHLDPDLRQRVAQPGQLWIDGGRFSRRDYADQVAAQVYGRVMVQGFGRQTVFTVRLGPFQTISDADRALDQSRQAGVTGARIFVE